MFKRKSSIILMTVYLIMIVSETAGAMHIAEGFLPATWAGFWWVLALPFIAFGIRRIRKMVAGEDSGIKILLAVAGAFVFVLSSLKLPSLTGSCSHPTGIGLGAILFGPWPMVILGCIVLIFQALLLAHGGVTTLGANVFSMAIIGAFVAYGIYKISRKMGAPLWLSVFLAAALGDLITYITTASQLALAFPAGDGGVMASLIKFMGVFAITQVPLAIIEGLLTVLVFNLIRAYGRDELKQLSIFSGGDRINEPG